MTMYRIVKGLRSPGAMRPTAQAAPTRLPNWDGKVEPDYPNSATCIANDRGVTTTSKARLLDRWLDKVVRASGSIVVFGCIQAGLWGWAFSGIALSSAPLWPVLISDVQAILSYCFDSLLMRQQLNGYYEGIQTAAEIRSRGKSVRAMFQGLAGQLRKDQMQEAFAAVHGLSRPSIELPSPNRFTKVINMIASFIGHVGFVAFYWAAIFFWLGFGPYKNWSNQWQLDINSATSALMVFIFSFLAILRERHSDYVRACIDAIYRVDSTLELKLRVITGHRRENPTIDIPAAKVHFVQRAINYYADIVGALTGVALLIVVLVVWVAIGPALNFSTNWWLLIGTYAGLIGLIDGFVLRNVQTKLRAHEDPQYALIDTEDCETFNQLGLTPPTVASFKSKKISSRISETIGKLCGHEMMVLAGVLLVFGLLAGASVMRWNETGQLLCNIPPSVIESFFMIILITGHNAADAQRRVDLANMFERRLMLLSLVDVVHDMGYESRVAKPKPAMVKLEIEDTEPEV